MTARWAWTVTQHRDRQVEALTSGRDFARPSGKTFNPCAPRLLDHVAYVPVAKRPAPRLSLLVVEEELRSRRTVRGAQLCRDQAMVRHPGRALACASCTARDFRCASASRRRVILGRFGINTVAGSPIEGADAGTAGIASPACRLGMDLGRARELLGRRTRPRTPLLRSTMAA